MNSLESVCLHVCAGVPGGQKRALDALKIQLQEVVSHHVRSGNWTEVLCSVSPALIMNIFDKEIRQTILFTMASRKKNKFVEIIYKETFEDRKGGQGRDGELEGLPCSRVGTIDIGKWIYCKK